MFFDDEKDFIESSADIHIDEDGTVTWEDVLNSDDDDDIVSVNKELKKKPREIVDLGDDLELVQDVDDDVDDEELAQILSEDASPKQKAFDAFGSEQKEVSEDEFDIDSQLTSVANEQNKLNEEAEDEVLIPRKETKKQSGPSPLFIAIIFAAVVAGVAYFFINYTKEQELANETLPQANAIQQQLNDATAQEIADRVDEPQQPQDIPVVNEENVDEIKVDTEKKEEKKEVINVVPTGRNNPFMPIQKYVSVKLPETIIEYDKAGIPKPPEEYGIQSEEATKLLTISVSGIMYDEDKPSAIITLDNNDYFVQKDDMLDSYKIVKIAKNYVEIALGKNIYKANVGEEFKITHNFEGVATYQEDGTRKYVTKMETQNNSSGSRYVSEEDVVIRAR